MQHGRSEFSTSQRMMVFFKYIIKHTVIISVNTSIKGVLDSSYCCPELLGTPRKLQYCWCCYLQTHENKQALISVTTLTSKWPRTFHFPDIQRRQQWVKISEALCNIIVMDKKYMSSNQRVSLEQKNLFSEAQRPDIMQ